MMANKKGRRRFGNVRRLASGRYQASYVRPDGLRQNGPNTFATKADATVWLTLRESELVRGEWTDPNLGEIRLRDFGRTWIAEHRLSVRTRELYEGLFRLHVAPFLGEKRIGELTTPMIRQWRAKLLEAGRSEITVAKAYRLLRAILNTAVDDGSIGRNPCRIKGADKEYSPERPIASVPEVYALADLVGDRYRVLVLAAAFTGLRWGELIAQRRRDVDLVAPSLRVPRRLAEPRSGQPEEGPTKSGAGFRTVALPEVLVEPLRHHLATYVAADPDSLIFTGPKGAMLRRSNWRMSVRWSEKAAAAGLPRGFHFHDLRHTGNHLAAMSGASTRELMHRMGHGSVRAALIYQHATSERDRELAARLSALVETSGPGPHQEGGPSSESHANRTDGQSDAGVDPLRKGDESADLA